MLTSRSTENFVTDRAHHFIIDFQEVTTYEVKRVVNNVLTEVVGIIHVTVKGGVKFCGSARTYLKASEMREIVSIMEEIEKS